MRTKTGRVAMAFGVLAACQTKSPQVEGPLGSIGVGVVPYLSFEDLRYELPAGLDDGFATLDLYRPDDTRRRPLVVLVHGGSWIGGDKSNFADAAPDFVPWWIARGFVVAAVNFRLATPVGRPLSVGPRDQASDIAHAVAWLLEDAKAHHVDASAQVVLVGYSSGAHLVALLGADGGLAAAAGLEPGQVGATVSLDVHVYDAPFALELMEGSVVEPNMPLIRHLFGETREEQLQASPITYVAGAVAPALLVSVEPSLTDRTTHGYIVHAAAEHYAAALRDAGHVVRALHDEGESHASLAVGFGAEGDIVTGAVGEFLEDVP